MYDYLIVGAGISGCVIAERVANILNKKVLIIDSRNHIGGNCYDYLDENGILVHKYGPHIFHTKSKLVFDYISKFTEWEVYFHRVLANVDGIDIPVPFNFDAIYKVFPPKLANEIESKLLEKYSYGQKIPILELRKSSDPLLKFLYEYIYEKIFLNYTIKQWHLSPDEIDESITGRIPVYLSRDDRYFQDKYQAMPKDGYTAIFNKMIAHPNIELKLNMRLSDIENEISYDKLIYTGKIDEFFDYKYGELPYRSLDFKLEVYEIEFYQKVAQNNFPNNFDFTRITEFKHFYKRKINNNTIVAKEYPTQHIIGQNEAYYPIINNENKILYDKYINEAKQLENVYFIGRLAEYMYYNMDETFLSALKLFDILKENNVTH